MRAATGCAMKERHANDATPDLRTSEENDMAVANSFEMVDK